MRRALALLLALGLLFWALGHAAEPDAGETPARVAERTTVEQRQVLRGRGRRLDARDPAKQVEAPDARAADVRAGRVVDDRGLPVSGAWLEFARKKVRGIGQVRTDPRGRFEAPERVGPGHLVGCWCKGYYGYRGSWPAGEASLTIHLRATACLEGQVLDDRGDPVPFVMIEARGEGRTEHVRPSQGRWRLFLPAGTHDLRARSQAGLLAKWQVRVEDGETVRRDLAPPGTRVVRPRILPPVATPSTRRTRGLNVARFMKQPG